MITIATITIATITFATITVASITIAIHSCHTFTVTMVIATITTGTITINIAFYLRLPKREKNNEQRTSVGHQ